MPLIKTLDVIAAACAAYRENNDQIILESSDSTLTPNIKLLHAALSDNTKVTDLDRANAAEIIEFLTHQQTLAGLTGKKLSDFVANVIETVAAEEVNPRFALSRLQWAPRLHMDMQKSQDIRNQLAVLSYGSKYLGKQYDKIEITFVTVSKRYNKMYQAWRYTGHDTHGNLVGFLLNKDIIAKEFKIKGSIKNIEMSRYAENGKTTFLSHVREIK
jgi:hypothetical protein